MSVTGSGYVYFSAATFPISLLLSFSTKLSFVFAGEASVVTFAIIGAVGFAAAFLGAYLDAGLD